jgi:hypothetical protein
MGGACSKDRRYAYNILVGKPERKRILEKPRCRRVDNVRMGFKK